MKGLFLATSVAVGLLIAPGEARACPGSSAARALIHDALPRPLPQGTIIADVIFEATSAQRSGPRGLRARIRRMIQGDYRGTVLIVRQRRLTICDAPFENGRAGLIVGIPYGVEDGMPIVDPIMSVHSRRHRLPDGFRLDAARPGTRPTGQ